MSDLAQVVEILDSIQKDAFEIRRSVAIETDYNLQAIPEALGNIRKALGTIQEEIRTMPETVFERLEKKKLILDITSLDEAKANIWCYSFAVTNQPKPDYRPVWGWLLIYVTSIPFWLAALYLLVRFVKWAWFR